MIKKMVGDQQIDNDAIAVKKRGWDYLEPGPGYQMNYFAVRSSSREEEDGNREAATGMGLVELYRLMACNDVSS